MTGNSLALTRGCTGILWSGSKIIRLLWSCIFWACCPQLARVKHRLLPVKEHGPKKELQALVWFNNLPQQNWQQRLSPLFCSHVALYTNRLVGRIKDCNWWRGKALFVFSHSLWKWKEKILLKIYFLHLWAHNFSKILQHISPLAIKESRENTVWGGSGPSSHNGTNKVTQSVQTGSTWV